MQAVVDTPQVSYPPPAFLQTPPCPSLAGKSCFEVCFELPSLHCSRSQRIPQRQERVFFQMNDSVLYKCVFVVVETPPPRPFLVWGVACCQSCHGLAVISERSESSTCRIERLVPMYFPEQLSPGHCPHLGGRPAGAKSPSSHFSSPSPSQGFVSKCRAPGRLRGATFRFLKPFLKRNGLLTVYHNFPGSSMTFLGK